MERTVGLYRSILRLRKLPLEMPKKACWLAGLLLLLIVQRAEAVVDGWVLALSWHPGFCVNLTALRLSSEAMVRSGEAPDGALPGSIWRQRWLNAVICYCGMEVTRWPRD